MNEIEEHRFCECDEFVHEYRGQLSNEMRPYYLKSVVDAVLAEKDAEIRRLNRLLWNARATAAKNAAGEVHNLIVCMRERHPNMTLSNTEARERELLEKARRCRRKAKEWR